MGVPALFRWLSKKYPKIVYRVQEDTPTKVRGEDGEIVEIPVKYESENPNGFEVDNLYLDMNGIVHPCTHPEGRPAPETEEEMMVEVFRYTERVVNMARPRKVLVMAIDGVAPRAKMNQQRSRRFRSAQEAADKEIERQESIKMYEAMGQTVSDETKNKKAWDSNAITPGTPFMDLLSKSLKYWVANKMSTDPGWKDLKVIISDASVPGEGEHKIVDWIRRQRSHPSWDANTSHAIYGLDADLIMLGLATHEPNFRVLREDVFAQGNRGPQTCGNCGKMGHIKVNCKQPKMQKDPNEVEKAVPVDPKPFIWLDVNILREYLNVELNVPNVPFPFDPELAIDDWIFMIFFVGNDFLPHLPSLEIREGAIDSLLGIWRNELPRMGGYLTNHGKVNLGRAQIILDGLAGREDGIFQKRKEDEDRQKSREKRRRDDEHRRQDRENGISTNDDPGSMQMNGQDYVTVNATNPVDTARGGSMHPSLPKRPGFDTVPTEPEQKPAFKPGKKLTYAQQAESLKAGLAAMSGSNADIVKNRKAIRMANMSAAEKLKAELEGSDAAGDKEDGDEPMEENEEKPEVPAEQEEDEEEEEEDDAEEATPGSKRKKRGRTSRHRKARRVDDDDDEDDEEDEKEEEDEEAPANPEDEHTAKKKLKVNPDGTVDYEDTVRLWEPGYRERYYRQKFGTELSDTKFISEITRAYMEGLCWVLEYYYQGVPAWDWYYPYHYAPFAQDFQNVGDLDIQFKISQPFKPFAQLLGVFPAASRIHLPPVLQTLMTEEDSPILDFYPEDFEIDMNGKKMQWQGVALLPFIDQTRLLTALKSKEAELSDDEKRRNSWGDNVMFIAEENLLFDPFCQLYGVKGGGKLVPLDPKMSLGITGSVLPDPNCVPNASMDTPLPSIDDCPDLLNNRSLSVRYFFPRQMHRHRSTILPGYKPGLPKLTESDRDWTRRGGHEKRQGPGHRGPGGNRHGGGPGGGPGGGGRGGRHGQQGHNGGGYGQGSYGNSGGYAQGSGGYGGASGGYGGGGGYGGSSGGYGGSSGGYGGGRNPYGASQPTAAYGGGAGGGYGGYGGGGSYGGGGGYGGAGAGGYGAGGRNAYGGQQAYGAPARGGYGGGYGGAGGRGGGYGGAGGRGGYGGAPRGRY